MKKKIIVLALTATAGFSTWAFAEGTGGWVISQMGKKFSEREITVNAGESVTFLNDDETTHNVHSISAGNEFDLGAQGPGESMSHVFDTPGKVKVRCAIHPKMKITVNVQ